MHSKKLLLSVVLAGLLTVSALAVPAVSHGQTGDKSRISGITEFEISEIDSFAESKILDRSIQKGIYYLYENQLPSGEFPTYLAFSSDMRDGINVTTVFDTAFVLHTLNLVDNKHTKKKVQTMKTKAITFLLNNKEPHGVWKWIKHDPGTPAEPPDTDDTSLVFSALVESGVNISDESLDYMEAYRRPDGIFYTWINSEEWLDPSNSFYEHYKTNDIDANVNTNILYAYSLRDRNQNGIVQYLNDIAENKSFLNGTLYYSSPYVFAYLVTKAYSDGDVKELEPALINLKEYLLETQSTDGGWGNDLHTALAANSLINMGYEGKPLEKAVEHILRTQRKNGSWEIYAFYNAPQDPADYSPNPLTPQIYFGSQEITTSFSIEALLKYKKTIEQDELEYSFARKNGIKGSWIYG